MSFDVLFYDRRVPSRPVSLCDSSYVHSLIQGDASDEAHEVEQAVCVCRLPGSLVSDYS
jgi:hypothetical protein